MIHYVYKQHMKINVQIKNKFFKKDQFLDR